MSEDLQLIDPVNVNNWGKILDASHERVRHTGVVLSEDRLSLERINPNRALVSSILPEHGEPVEGAHLAIASGELTVHSTRTTGKEYAVVELRLLLPVKRILGREIEYSLENPAFEAKLKKREYVQSVGGTVLESYMFGLGMDSLATLVEGKPGSEDPYQRLAKMMLDKSDPGSNETELKEKRSGLSHRRFTKRSRPSMIHVKDPI